MAKAKTPPDKPLTAKQERFVAEYVKDFNGLRAAEAAGYSTKAAKVQASRMLTNANVAAAVAVAKAQQTDRLAIDADVFIQELAAICLADVAEAFDENGNLLPIQKMPRHFRRAIAGMDVVIRNAKAGDGVTDTIHKIKTVDKKGALELMFRHLALLVDRKEVGEPGAFQKLSDEELKARMKAALAKL